MQTQKPLSAGSLCRPLVSSPLSKGPKRTFILHQKYHASVSNKLSQPVKCFIERKTNINFKSQTWIRTTQSGGTRALFYPISIIPQIATEDSGILQLTKNAKTNNKIAGYHLVSHRVISTPSDVQRVFLRYDLKNL